MRLRASSVGEVRGQTCENKAKEVKISTSLTVVQNEINIMELAHVSVNIFGASCGEMCYNVNAIYVLSQNRSSERAL